MGAGNQQPFITPSKYPEVLWDPAIEKWAHMKENTHVYYRLTPRTAKIGFILGVVVPCALYGLVKWGQGKWDPSKIMPGQKRWGEKRDTWF